MGNTIAIIGAGIAGLAAGCYGQMNGYQTEIFELHELPGGLCTAWDRKDYTIDGCIHYLYGSGAGQPFNQMWQELGAVQSTQFFHHDEYMRLRSPQGREFVVYTDPEKLEQHLCELSPEDAPLSKALANGVRQFTRFDLSRLVEKPKALMGITDWMKLGIEMLPFLPGLLRWGFISARQLGERFQDPFLRQAVPQMFSWEEIPVMVGLSLLAYMHTGNAGFPVGGSLEFARRLEQRYLELGGRIHYKAQVDKVVIEDGQAVGVRLYNDEVHRAGRVISAADARAAMYDMIGAPHIHPSLARSFDGRLPIHSQIQVSLGVNRDLANTPHWVTQFLEQPLTIAGEEIHALSIKHYSFDASLAPQGKAVIEVMLPAAYGYWQRIYGHRLYDTEQLQVADQVIDCLEKWYPGLRNDIEVCDVATPLSYERYTGNWRGSSCGWLLTTQTMWLMLRGMPKTLPRLRNFHLAGQWVEPGGSVPVAAASGRNCIKQICIEDGRGFVTSTP